MADNARDKGNSGDPPPDGAAYSARLQRLGQRIGETEAHRHPPAVQNASDPSALARGFRLSSELVAGVLVGAGIGWLLDRWLGISPWGMIVFLLLGFAAGVFNVMRAAGVGRPPGTGTH